MRHKWEEHNQYAGVQELYIRFGDGRTSEWRLVGWVQNHPVSGEGFRVYCHWISDGDYPENKVFETAKQARRALKATATVAIIGGFRGL
jgi:hypothetical protein